MTLAVLSLGCSSAPQPLDPPVQLDLVEEVLLTGATFGAAPLPDHAVAFSAGAQIGVLDAHGELSWYGGEGDLLDATWVGDTLVVATDGALLAGETRLQASPLPVGPVHRVEARDEHLFLASDALYRWEEDRLTELTLDGRSLGPDFALEQGIWTIQDGVAVRVGQTLPAQDAEQVGPCMVVAGDELAYWNGAWERWTLEAPLEWLDGPKDSAWGGSGDRLYHLGPTYGVVDAPEGRVTVDSLGRLLVSGPDGLRRLSVGYPIGLVGLEDGGTLMADTVLTVAPTLPDKLVSLEVDIDGVAQEVEDLRFSVRTADWEEGPLHRLTVTASYADSTATREWSFRTEGLGTVTWDDHVQPLYTDRCSVCHDSSTATVLDTAEAWASNYALIWAAVTEERMPIGDDPLTERELALVAAWAEGDFP